MSRSKLFILFQLTIIAGFVISHYYLDNLSYYWSFIIISLFIISFFFKHKKPKIIIFIIAIALFISSIFFQNFKNSFYPQVLPYDQKIQFEAKVVSYPDLREKNNRYILKIQNVISSCDNCQNLLDQKILLITDPFMRYHFNDILFVSSLIEKPSNFDDFDYISYLSRYEIFAISRFNQYKPEQLTTKKIDKSQNARWMGAIYRFKDNLTQKISKNIPEPESGVISAMTLGNKRAIDPTLYDILSLIGISHLVVISGFHVSIIIKIFTDLTSNLGKCYFFILSSLLLLVLIIFIGFTPSVIRASVMAWLFVLSRMIGRKGSILPIFIFTCFVMILQNPLILFYDFGFQLSVLSVSGLIFIMPILQKYIFYKESVISTILSATFSAQLMTLPLVVYQFSRLSIIAPLANLLIVPVAPAIIICGITSALLFFVHPLVGKIAALIPYVLTRYLIYISRLLSNISIASINIHIDKWYYVFIIYILIFLSIFYINKKNEILPCQTLNYKIQKHSDKL